ncbi:MAG: hypothetical protein K6357_05505 [Elusimicrobiota bacterium]
MRDKFLSFFCLICPFCIAKRRWQDSFYAKLVKKIERYCPFCLAYNRIYKSK